MNYLELETRGAMTARVTISLPNDLLASLDAIAESESLTRSDVVREAAGAYITAHAGGLEATRRQRAVEDGIAWLKEIAAQPSLDSRPSLQILREIRGETDEGGAVRKTGGSVAGGEDL